MPTAKPIKIALRTRGSGNTTIHLKIPEDIEITLDSSAIVDEVTGDLLAHHHKAIKAGQRASGGPQKSLMKAGTQGRLAASGERPNIRGERGGDTILSLADGLTRTAISGGVKTSKRIPIYVTAKAEIKPHRIHEGFVAAEAAGSKSKQAGVVEYLYIDGDANRVVDAALERVVNQMLEGHEVAWNQKELEARAVKKKV